MAVTYDTVNVNSDTTGWTRLDVLDALETVFSNLGMHGGTAKTGVPVCALWPGQTNNEAPVASFNGVTSTETYNYDWMHCGGSALAWNSSSAQRKFEVTHNGTTSYYMQETWLPSAVDTAADTVTVPYNDVLTTGTALVWIPSGGDATNDIGGLTRGNTYYVIRVDSTKIKLAANSTDAGNNTAISLSGSPSSGWNSTTRFWIPEASSSNVEIVAYQGDTLEFNVGATNMHICSGSSYDSTKTLTYDNRENLPFLAGNTNAYVTNGGTTTVNFSTGHWAQSEDNANPESFDKPSSLRKGNVNQSYWRADISWKVGEIGIHGSRVVEYCYAHSSEANLKGTITILPKYCSAAQSMNPYWDVTIPGTVTGGGGSGKDLKMRVHRYHSGSSSTYRGRIKSIEVLNVTDGWSGTPTFTIAGENIGGVATTNDIEFGVNADETSSDVGDGICSLVMTDYGAGSTFYQKSATGDYAVLKLVHDAAKDFGTTYYMFCPGQSNPYEIQIVSGVYWESQNCWGTTATPDNTSRNTYHWKGFYGFMDGVIGGSTTATTQYAEPNSNTYYWHRNFATTAQPTDYKLRLKYWRAQSPQDDTFAIIQFYQVINNINTEYFTFSLPAATWGVTSPGVDLDHLYQGHIMEYVNGSGGNNATRAVDIRMYIPAYDVNQSQPGDEPIDSYTLTMDSAYGYLRNPNYGTAYQADRYAANIMTDNPTTERAVLQYYRNEDYDKTHSSMDYYRPIKGIPLLNCFAPCPYYMPDDFVMIQIGSAPGLTTFKTGDTITVSGSEKYEIIVAGVENSVEGLDGVSNGSSIGMCLCARTVG